MAYNMTFNSPTSHGKPSHQNIFKKDKKFESPILSILNILMPIGS